MTTTIDRDEVERVAAKLSSKRHEALLWLPADGAWTEGRAYWKVAPHVVWLERQPNPLAEAKIVGKNGPGNDLRHRLTQRGLAVRQYLLEQEQQS